MRPLVTVLRLLAWAWIIGYSTVTVVFARGVIEDPALQFGPTQVALLLFGLGVLCTPAIVILKFVRMRMQPSTAPVIPPPPPGPPPTAG